MHSAEEHECLKRNRALYIGPPEDHCPKWKQVEAAALFALAVQLPLNGFQVTILFCHWLKYSLADGSVYHNAMLLQFVCVFNALLLLKWPFWALLSMFSISQGHVSQQKLLLLKKIIPYKGGISRLPAQTWSRGPFCHGFNLFDKCFAGTELFRCSPSESHTSFK